MAIVKWKKVEKLKANNKNIDRMILIEANGYYGVISARTVLINEKNTIEHWAEIPKPRKKKK